MFTTSNNFKIVIQIIQNLLNHEKARSEFQIEGSYCESMPSKEWNKLATTLPWWAVILATDDANKRKSLLQEGVAENPCVPVAAQESAGLYLRQHIGADPSPALEDVKLVGLVR